MARFVILLLSVFQAEAGPVIISKPGSNVSVNCPCLKSEGCHGGYMRWARFDTNGTVEVLDTDCQKQPCRFSSEVKSDSEIQLTVVGVQKDDSGRYYCGDKLSSHIDFKAGDALLHVGEEEVWTNNSKVVMLYEWFNDSLEDQRIKPRRCAELRCLVTGLGVPVTDILWRSSGGKNRTGQILESIKTDSGFQVMSQLQIPIRASYQFCYNNSDNEQARDSQYNSHNALQHEESDIDLENEKWWCEVHPGGNKIYKSDTFPLYIQIREDPVSEWYAVLSYAAITLSTVCVILLLILISHWLCYLRTGPEFQVEVQDSERPELTYTDIQFKQSSKSKSGRRHQHIKTQEDASLYSQVKYSGSSTTNGSPLTHTQEDEQPGITYTHLNIRQPSKSDERHRERRVNTQEETSLYSQVKKE